MIIWCVHCGLAWHSNNEFVVCPVCDLEQKLTQATDKTKEHEHALEIYANEETWDDDDWGIKSVNIVEYGCPGRIAREALGYRNITPT